MISHKPRLSVGMPVFNGEASIREAVDSLLQQDFADFELIISDNASTDATEAICREYMLSDSRVRYMRQARNIGVSANYNAVFRLARGEYFKWASGNDRCGQGFLRRCVSILDAQPEVVGVCPRVRLLYGAGGETEDYPDPALEAKDERPCRRYQWVVTRTRLNNMLNGMFRSQVLRRTPLIRPFLSSDVALMAEVALFGKFAEIPDVLFHRRMDAQSATKYFSDDKLTKHFVPGGAGKRLLLQTWRMVFAHLGAAMRVRIEARERACLLVFAAKCFIWSWRELWDDIVIACRLRAP